MEIVLSLNYKIKIPDCKFITITKVFVQILPMIIAALFKEILVSFANEYMKQELKPFVCECGNNREFIWKTRNAKLTTIKTMWSDIKVPQMQVQCSCCRKKMFITRPLLEMNRRERIPAIVRKKLALLGALATFRVTEKIVNMFGLKLSKMTIWRCVQQEAENIHFDLDPDELPAGEADGTGIPIQHIKKRGRELKVFVQKKVGGGVRIAGLSIGTYEGGWDKLFEPLRNSFKLFEEKFLLLTDGDTNILKGVGVDVVFQRCLWHIPHQLKYYLWADGVKKKTDIWFDLVARILVIVKLPRIPEDEGTIQSIIEKKQKQLKEMLQICEENGFTKCHTYLFNAQPDLFTAFEKKLHGKATSLVERVMRTVNLRINVGKWSEKGALNVNKIRLAHYYNGFDVKDAKPSENIEIVRVN